MRDIQTLYRKVDLITQSTAEDITSAATLHQWLESQGKRIDAQWALLHSDIGLCWGKFEEQQLIFSYQRLPDHNVATLEPTQFQRCYLFGPTAELLLWKHNASWRARVFCDDTARLMEPTEQQVELYYFDESQILAGTEAVPEPSQEQAHIAKSAGFTRTADGVEGLYHTVPLTEIAFADADKKRWRPLRLTIRHYLDQDADSGALYVAAGRLLNLSQCAPAAYAADATAAGEEQKHG